MLKILSESFRIKDTKSCCSKRSFSERYKRTKIRKMSANFQYRNLKSKEDIYYVLIDANNYIFIVLNLNFT